MNTETQNYTKSQAKDVLNMIAFNVLYNVFYNNNGDIIAKWRNNQKLTEDETGRFKIYLIQCLKVFSPQDAQLLEQANLSVDDLLNELLDLGHDFI